MQIDGSHFSALYAPKPLALGQTKRDPITIDADKFAHEEQTKPVDVTREQQEVTRVNDFQQSRFVRLFATDQEPSSSGNQSFAVPLPKGVQQYLQIEQLNSDDGQKLLDERV